MAFYRSIDVSRLPDVGEKPNQPQGFSFPKRSYGLKKGTNSIPAKMVPAMEVASL